MLYMNSHSILSNWLNADVKNAASICGECFNQNDEDYPPTP